MEEFKKELAIRKPRPQNDRLGIPLQSRITVIGGAGAMGSAIIRRLVGSGLLPRSSAMAAVDIDPEKLSVMYKEIGICVGIAVEDGMNFGRTIFLAVKPQTAPAVLEEMSPYIRDDHLILSIVAGLTLERLSASLKGHRRIIRCMPNTPALIGQGITAMAPLPEVPAEDVDLAERLLRAVGDVVRVDEANMNAVTGLSGSGPAYVYTFIEALIDAGVRVGLPRELARRLALGTVKGSTEMVSVSGLHPAALRDMVTSPGGTTIAAMEELEREGFRSSVYSAVAAAAERSAELSN